MEQGTILFSRSEKTATGGYLEGKIDWSAEGVVETNLRRLTLKLYCRKGNDNMTLTTATRGAWDFSLFAGEYTITATSPSDTKILLDWVKLQEVTLELSNDEDGLLTVPIGGSVTAPTGTSYDSLSTFGEESVTLGRVERIGILHSVSDGDFGGFVSVRWQPRSTSLYHRLRLALGNFSYDSAVMASTNLAIKNASLALPAYAAAELPDAVEGDLTVSLLTYGDAEGEDYVGMESATVTAHVPETEEFLPICSMTLSPNNEGLPTSLSGLYVQGISRMHAEFSASLRHGATLAATKVDAGNGSDIPAESGQVTVTGVITDSRGMTAVATQSVTVLPYAPPRLLPPAGMDGIACYRCDENGNANAMGSYVKLGATAVYSELSGSNGYTLSLCHKIEGGDFGDFTELSHSDGDVNPVSGFDPHLSYSLQLRITDLVGQSHTVNLTLPTGAVDFHLGKGGGMAAFGKYAERQKALEIAPDWDFYLRGMPLSDFTVETGQTEVWYHRRHLDGSVQLTGRTSVVPVAAGTLAGWQISEACRIPLPFGVKNAIVQASTTGLCLPIECSVEDGEVSLCLLSPTTFDGTPVTLMLTVAGEGSEN